MNEEEKIEHTEKDMSDDELSDSFVARQIVHEIMNFGVNQSQLKRVIHILSLELEDRDLMLTLSDIIEKNLGISDDSQANKAKSLITQL